MNNYKIIVTYDQEGKDINEIFISTLKEIINNNCLQDKNIVLSNYTYLSLQKEDKN